jgi:hypothetical protein
MQEWISVINSKNITVLDHLSKSGAFPFVLCVNNTQLYNMTTWPSRTSHYNRQLTVRTNFLHQLIENIFAPWKCTHKKSMPTGEWILLLQLTALRHSHMSLVWDFVSWFKTTCFETNINTEEEKSKGGRIWGMSYVKFVKIPFQIYSCALV